MLGVRPEHLEIGSGDDGRGGPLPATVAVVESLGHERHVICRLDDGQMVIVRIQSEEAVPGADVDGAVVGRSRTAAPVRRRHRAPDRRVKSRRRRTREMSLAYFLLLPSLLIFAVFVFYPFFRNFYLGLYSTPPFPGLPKRWVGLEQYQDVLTSSSFFNSLKVTVAFAILTVPAGIVFGLGLAVLAHHQLKGIAIYRTIFSSTVATSVAVASVIFGTLFNPVVGLLPWIGINPRPPILDNPDLALAAVAVITIWQTLGLTFILMSSGLQAIPDELNEAAEVDGAGPARRFWQVTLPMLSPTIFFAVIVGSIFAFQTFGQIDLLTQGGPLQTHQRAHLLDLHDAATTEQRRQGRGARGRVVLHHADAHARADPRARAAGALWPLTDTRATSAHRAPRAPLRPAHGPRGDRDLPDLHHGRELAPDPAGDHVASTDPVPDEPDLGRATPTCGTSERCRSTS